MSGLNYYLIPAWRSPLHHTRASLALRTDYTGAKKAGVGFAMPRLHHEAFACASRRLHRQNKLVNRHGLFCCVTHENGYFFFPLKERRNSPSRELDPERKTRFIRYLRMDLGKAVRAGACACAGLGLSIASVPGLVWASPRALWWFCSASCGLVLVWASPRALWRVCPAWRSPHGVPRFGLSIGPAVLSCLLPAPNPTFKGLCGASPWNGCTPHLCLVYLFIYSFDLFFFLDSINSNW